MIAERTRDRETSASRRGAFDFLAGKNEAPNNPKNQFSFGVQTGADAMDG
jgi:hypothetical protein